MKHFMFENLFANTGRLTSLCRRLSILTLLCIFASMGLMAQSTPKPIYQDGKWYSFLDNQTYHINDPSLDHTDDKSGVPAGAIHVYDISSTYRPRKNSVTIDFVLFVSGYTYRPWYMDIDVDHDEAYYLSHLVKTNNQRFDQSTTGFACFGGGYNYEIYKYNSTTKASYLISRTGGSDNGYENTDAFWQTPDNYKTIGLLYPYVYRKPHENPITDDELANAYKSLDTEITISDANTTIGFFKSSNTTNTNLYIANCRIEVAQHILLVGGTNGYGANSGDIGFDKIAVSQSQSVSIPLRSFLSGASGLTFTLTKPDGTAAETDDLSSLTIQVRQPNGTYVSYPLNSADLQGILASACSYNGANYSADGHPLEADDLFRLVYTPVSGSDGLNSKLVISTGNGTGEKITLNITAAAPSAAPTVVYNVTTGETVSSKVAGLIPAGAQNVTYSVVPSSSGSTSAGSITLRADGETVTVKADGHVNVLVSYDYNGVHKEDVATLNAIMPTFGWDADAPANNITYMTARTRIYLDATPDDDDIIIYNESEDEYDVYSGGTVYNFNGGGYIKAIATDVVGDYTVQYSFKNGDEQQGVYYYENNDLHGGYSYSMTTPAYSSNARNGGHCIAIHVSLDEPKEFTVLATFMQDGEEIGTCEKTITAMPQVVSGNSKGYDLHLYGRNTIDVLTDMSSNNINSVLGSDYDLGVVFADETSGDYIEFSEENITLTKSADAGSDKTFKGYIEFEKENWLINYIYAEVTIDNPLKPIEMPLGGFENVVFEDGDKMPGYTITGVTVPNDYDDYLDVDCSSTPCKVISTGDSNTPDNMTVTVELTPTGGGNPITVPLDVTITKDYTFSWAGNSSTVDGMSAYTRLYIGGEPDTVTFESYYPDGIYSKFYPNIRYSNNHTYVVPYGTENYGQVYNLGGGVYAVMRGYVLGTDYTVEYTLENGGGNAYLYKTGENLNVYNTSIAYGFMEVSKNLEEAATVNLIATIKNSEGVVIGKCLKPITVIPQVKADSRGGLNLSLTSAGANIVDDLENKESDFTYEFDFPFGPDELQTDDFTTYFSLSNTGVITVETIPSNVIKEYRGLLEISKDEHNYLINYVYSDISLGNVTDVTLKWETAPEAFSGYNYDWFNLFYGTTFNAPVVAVAKSGDTPIEDAMIVYHIIDARGVDGDLTNTKYLAEGDNFSDYTGEATIDADGYITYTKPGTIKVVADVDPNGKYKAEYIYGGIDANVVPEGTAACSPLKFTYGDDDKVILINEEIYLPYCTEAGYWVDEDETVIDPIVKFSIVGDSIPEEYSDYLDIDVDNGTVQAIRANVDENGDPIEMTVYVMVSNEDFVENLYLPVVVTVDKAKADITAEDKYVVAGSLNNGIGASARYGLTDPVDLSTSLEYQAVTPTSGVTINNNGTISVAEGVSTGTEVEVVVSLDNANYKAESETITVTVIAAPETLELTYGDTEGKTPDIASILPDELKGDDIIITYETTDADYATVSGNKIVPEDVTTDPVEVIVHIEKVVDSETISVVDIPVPVVVAKADPGLEVEGATVMTPNSSQTVRGIVDDAVNAEIASEKKHIIYNIVGGPIDGVEIDETTGELTIDDDVDPSTLGYIVVQVETPETEHYNADVETFKVTIVPAPTIPDINLVTGDNTGVAPTIELPGGLTPGEVTYTEESDAVHVSDGYVIPDGVTGTTPAEVVATITTKEGVTINVPFNVYVKAEPELSWNEEPINMTKSANQTVVAVSTNTEATIEYSIVDADDDATSYTGKATIDADGAIHPIQTGTIKVVATSPETDSYVEGTIYKEIEVVADFSVADITKYLDEYPQTPVITDGGLAGYTVTYTATGGYTECVKADNDNHQIKTECYAYWAKFKAEFEKEGYVINDCEFYAYVNKREATVEVETPLIMTPGTEQTLSASASASGASVEIDEFFFSSSSNYVSNTGKVTVAADAEPGDIDVIVYVEDADYTADPVAVTIKVVPLPTAEDLTLKYGETGVPTVTYDEEIGTGVTVTYEVPTAYAQYLVVNADGELEALKPYFVNGELGVIPVTVKSSKEGCVIADITANVKVAPADQKVDWITTPDDMTPHNMVVGETQTVGAQAKAGADGSGDVLNTTITYSIVGYGDDAGKDLTGKISIDPTTGEITASETCAVKVIATSTDPNSNYATSTVEQKIVVSKADPVITLVADGHEVAVGGTIYTYSGGSVDLKGTNSSAYGEGHQFVTVGLQVLTGNGQVYETTPAASISVDSVMTVDNFPTNGMFRLNVTSPDTKFFNPGQATYYVRVFQINNGEMIVGQTRSLVENTTNNIAYSFVQECVRLGLGYEFVVPTGLTINSTDNTITATAVGEYICYAVVKDNAGNELTRVQFTVTVGKATPTITAPASVEVYVGETVDIDAQSSNPELPWSDDVHTDNVTYSIDPNCTSCSGISVNPNTGVVSVDANTTMYAGTVVKVIATSAATDNYEAVTKVIPVTILKPTVNTITSHNKAVTPGVNRPISYIVEATTAAAGDDDAVTYELISAPTGVTLDEDGLHVPNDVEIDNENNPILIKATSQGFTTDDARYIADVETLTVNIYPKPTLYSNVFEIPWGNLDEDDGFYYHSIDGEFYIHYDNPKSTTGAYLYQYKGGAFEYKILTTGVENYAKVDAQNVPFGDGRGGSRNVRKDYFAVAQDYHNADSTLKPIDVCVKFSLDGLTSSRDWGSDLLTFDDMVVMPDTMMIDIRVGASPTKIVLDNEDALETIFAGTTQSIQSHIESGWWTGYVPNQEEYYGDFETLDEIPIFEIWNSNGSAQVDATVAYVDADGEIHAIVPGTYRLVAKTDFTGQDAVEYRPKMMWKTITVLPLAVIDPVNTKVGAADIAPTVTTPAPDGYSGPVYSTNNSSNGYVTIVNNQVHAAAANVDENGTPVEMTIDATYTDGEGHQIVVPVKVTVDKGDVAIAGPTSVNAYKGGTTNIDAQSDNPQLQNNVDNVTYALDCENDCGGVSINPNTGVITVAPDATATSVNVIVTSEPTSNYKGATKTIPVTISPAPQVGDLTLNYDVTAGGQPTVTLPTELQGATISYVIPDGETHIHNSNDGTGNIIPDAATTTAVQVTAVITKGDVTINVPFNVTVDKANPTITWPNITTATVDYDPTTNEFSYRETNLTVDLDAQLDFTDRTDIDALPSNYSIETGSSIATVDADGNLIISGVGTVKIKVTFPATENYCGTNGADDPITEIWEFTVKAVPLEITICENGKDGDGNPIIDDGEPDGVVDFEKFAAKGKTVVNTASYQATVTTELVDLGVLSTNYNNVSYTIAAGTGADATKAAVINGKLDAYRLGTYPLTITATAANGATATCSLSINIPRGTMKFENEGNWNTNSCWHRPDILPLGVNHNVEILANCTVSTTNKADNSTNVTGVPADCYDLTVTSGTLTIASTGALKVRDILTSDDVSKILIKADEDGAGSVLFGTETAAYKPTAPSSIKAYMPMDAPALPLATVELYCPGTTTDRDPVWQYRGIPVEKSYIYMNGSTGNYTGYGLPSIYKWTETYHDNGYGYEAWEKVSSGEISAWLGYTFSKYTTDTESAAYTVTAQGALLTGDHEYSLVKGTEEHYNQGNNLITNSFAAPVDLSELEATDFGENVPATVYFYNHGTYKDYRSYWEDQGDIFGLASSQVITWPIFSGEEANRSVSQIPSGESFFVWNKGAANSTATFTLRYAALADNTVNGKLHAPRETEDFNILDILVEGGENGDRLVLMENENCSKGFDNGYDGYKMLSAGNTPQLYATNDFGSTAINVDRYIMGQYVGFKAAKNGIKYTISFNTDRLDGYSSLYLYDIKENKYTNILNGETYTFTGTYSGEDKRFVIVGEREDGESRTGDDQRIEVVGDQVFVVGFDGVSEPLMMFDMSGKMVWQSNTIFGPWFDLPEAIPDGVYVIKAGNCQTKYVK